MAIVVWIVEGTWPACVDAARAHAPEDADIVLLHVTGQEIAGVAHGAFAASSAAAAPNAIPASRWSSSSPTPLRSCCRKRSTVWAGPVLVTSAPAASSARWSPRPKEPDCSSWPATATAAIWAPRAWAQPAGSSSIMPPALCCWCGPSKHPVWAASRHRPLGHPTTGKARSEGGADQAVT